MNLLEVGSKAPDFNTTDQNGKKVTLKVFTRRMTRPVALRRLAHSAIILQISRG
jgi:peroxiredoxin